MNSHKWYLTICSIAFTVIAISHLGLILFQIEATLAGYLVPAWANGIAVMLAGYLATRGFMEAHKIK